MGSRLGADLEHVVQFLTALWDSGHRPVVVSGGAEGVDTIAESTWLALGGDVVSFRAKRLPDYQGDEQYGIERWEMGATSRVFDLIHEPTFADYVSALYYRDILIARYCTRLAAFMRTGGSRGTSITCEFAADKPVFKFEAGKPSTS